MNTTGRHSNDRARAETEPSAEHANINKTSIEGGTFVTIIFCCSFVCLFVYLLSILVTIFKLYSTGGNQTPEEQWISANVQ